MIAPNPIQVSGLVTVTVDTQDADTVTMTIDPLGEAEEIELAPGNTPGTYVGQIEAFTGLNNGWHDLVLVPARGEETGEAVPAYFEIALPKPGTEGFFEAGDLIGPGEVKAIGMLPTKRLIELGSRTKQGKKSCYLRRRDPDGGWVLSDVIDLVPDLECEARDLKISSDGAMFVLLQVQGKNGPVWRLLEYSTWSASPKVRGVGSVGEQANALAEHEGTVAVCGTAPTQHIDELDVLIKIFRPNNLSGGGDVLDYKVNDDDADHFFSRQRPRLRLHWRWRRRPRRSRGHLRAAHLLGPLSEPAIHADVRPRRPARSRVVRLRRRGRPAELRHRGRRG